MTEVANCCFEGWLKLVNIRVCKHHHYVEAQFTFRWSGAEHQLWGFCLRFLNQISSLRWDKLEVLFSVWLGLCLFFQVLARKQNFWKQTGLTTGEFPKRETKALKRGGQLPGWRDTLNLGRLKISGWKCIPGLLPWPSLRYEVSAEWPQSCPFSSSWSLRLAATKNTEGKQCSLLTQGSLIWFFVAALYLKGNDITPIILLQSIPKL